MLYGMTSRDLKMEFHPFQDVFVGSSMEEISTSEILGRWFLSFRGRSFGKPFFTIQNLSPILQIEYSSSISIYQLLDFKSETALTEEFIRKDEKKKLLEEISKIMDEIVPKEELFKEINKTKLLNFISEILNNFTSEQLKISKDELFRRIRRVLLLESASGIFNELSPVEIKDLDDMVKRRPLFK
jgi:hypothetical protein